MSINFINNIFVNAYKYIGFFILLVCITSVLSYASIFCFYMVNRSWSTPLVLTPTQQKSLAARPEITMLESSLENAKLEVYRAKENYDELEQNNLELEKEIINIRRTRKIEATILEDKSQQLQSLQKDKRKMLLERDEIIQSMNLADQSIKNDLKAGLITRDEANNQKMKMFSLRDQSSSIDESIKMMSIEIQQLQTYANLLKEPNGGSSFAGNLSLYRENEIKSLISKNEIQRDYYSRQTSKLTTVIQKTTTALDTAKKSPYYLALYRKVYLGFVPYENMEVAKVGSKIYSCKFHFLYCHEVGHIKNIFDSEEYSRHPLYRTDLKGRMIELELSKNQVTTSKENVLFIGSKPFMF